MSKIINIGILGCANIAKKFVLPSLTALVEFNIVGIASRTPKKADAVASLFETKAFYSYESLLEVESLDAVYIPLPNSLHYEWIKKALDKNLNVLVEKSMACKYEEVLEITNLAKKRRLVLLENFQFRFHSQLATIESLLQSGIIGELRNIKSTFSFPPFSDINNIRYQKELCGGALLDAGAYPLKIAQIFMGKDVFVASSSLHIDEEKKVDTYGSFFLKELNSSVTAQGIFGFDNFYQCNIELLGSKGRIYTNRIFTAPPNYKVIIECETQNENKVIELDEDNHFTNMLLYFFTLINDKVEIDKEYKENITQARLLREVFKKSN